MLEPISKCENCRENGWLASRVASRPPSFVERKLGINNFSKEIQSSEYTY